MAIKADLLVLPGETEQWQTKQELLIDLFLENEAALGEVLVWMAANTNPSWQPGGDYTLDGGSY